MAIGNHRYKLQYIEANSGLRVQNLPIQYEQKEHGKKQQREQKKE
jgi:hypothetical protein